MLTRSRLLIFIPCALILVFVAARWIMRRIDPLGALAPYVVSSVDRFDRMRSISGAVEYVSERQIEVRGLDIAEIKRLLSKGRPLRGGYPWQDMYGISRGKKIWIGCSASGKDFISITPNPQNGKPTATYIVEINHPMTPSEVRAHNFMGFDGKPLK